MGVSLNILKWGYPATPVNDPNFSLELSTINHPCLGYLHGYGNPQETCSAEGSGHEPPGLSDHRSSIFLKGFHGDFRTTQGWWLLATPLKNMSSSIGRHKPNLCKNQKWQPNHQPGNMFGDRMRSEYIWGVVFNLMERNQTIPSLYYLTSPVHPTK